MSITNFNKLKQAVAGRGLFCILAEQAESTMRHRYMSPLEKQNILVNRHRERSIGVLEQWSVEIPMPSIHDSFFRILFLSRW